MTIKALFLDFYGTVVHEDDDIIPIICNEIKDESKIECDIKDIGGYWWKVFSKMFRDSYGKNFETQRTLGLKSLNKTILHFQSSAIGEKIIEKQFSHWQEPGIFNESINFLNFVDVPVYVLSNIDTEDILKAIEFHGLEVNGVITSEDVKSYKPRSEMFNEALRRYKLDKSEVLHVGDSLTSDVQGAQNFGIKAVWLNRKQKSLPEHIRPDYIFNDFEGLKGIL
jgi:2-haloalkanoic acid dehalogenase type II